MKLDIGTPVRYPDGEQVGTINKVIFDPETNTVHEIVVETPDLVGRLVLVPVSMLREDPGDVLTVAADRDAVDALPDYEVARYNDQPEGWEVSENYVPGGDMLAGALQYPVVPVMEESNAPAGSVELSQGTEVQCLDGRFGVVDQVLTDEADQITGLVVRPDDEAVPPLLVPLDLITSSDSLMVQLNCSIADLTAQSEPYMDPNAEPESDSLMPST
jgi:sporulation protein YlmC with PRC-barrel domain